MVLALIGALMACGSNYSSSSDGLIIVPSQGSAVLQAFSFDLSNGHVSQINTNPTVSSIPNAIVLDPAGAFAYVTSSASSTVSGSANIISSFKVNSDGTLSSVGTANFGGGASPAGQTGLAIDSAGKYLFVADVVSNVGGAVSVFSIGSGGSLTEVAGSPFPLPIPLAGTTPSPVSLAVTPTVFPSQFAACSGTQAPTTEFLYVADSVNYVVWDFAVDSSNGALTVNQASFPTGKVPAGVAVDPCNRFVFVANELDNTVSAYSICNSRNSPTATCPNPDGSLVSVGPATPAGNGPGPMAVDPLGNFLYVVDRESSQLSGYRFSQVAGTLTPFAQTLNTGAAPVSIAIRGDDQWLFVTNNGSAIGNGSVSQFSLVPTTGILTPVGGGILTDTYPFGIAVK
jgi:6-phosphogluconolactonase (cycloisomerase 2 family)